MASSTSSNAGNGIGLATVLTIVFMVLKLTHYIDWSWWWVLSPLWITAGLTVLFIAVVLGIAVVKTSGE